MGSSEITSRLVAQTTEDTGLTPGGVIAARPLTGETASGAGRPHAAATTAHAAVTATTIHRFDFLLIRPPRRSRSHVGKALWWGTIGAGGSRAWTTSAPDRSC